MKNRKPIAARTIQMVLILVALTFAPSAMADGCTVDVVPTQLVDVGDFDGNMSCTNWPSMTGSCSLDPSEDGPVVECQIDSGGQAITVYAEMVGGVINWWTDPVGPGLGGIDKVILDNAANANGCLQNNKFDAVSGSIVFYKSNGLPQPSKGIEVCADDKISVAPPIPQVAEKFLSCQVPGAELPGGIDDTSGGLDETGIVCPTYQDQDECDVAAQAAFDAGKIGSLQEFECVPGVTQKPVVVCNLEKDKEDWGTTDGSDVCCQCGIPEADQTACVVTEDKDSCENTMTVNPTQTVELMFFKDDVDPCTWKKTSKGWTQVCWK